MSKISEQRRREILTAAAAEFFASGMERASISAIAARVGIGKSTVYEYFSSKTELLTAVFQWKIQQLREKAEETLTAEKPFREKLLEYYRECWPNPMDQNAIFSLLQQSSLQEFPVTQVLELIDDVQLLLEDVVRQGQAEGEISGQLDVRLTACVLLNLWNPHLIHYMHQKQIACPEQEILDLILNGLKAR